MSTVANLYPPAASWTFQNASLAGNVLTIGAGGDAHFSITPGENVQAARTYNIKLTSSAYTDPYAPASFLYMKVKYSATEYVDVKAPIVNMGTGYETTVELSQAVFETFIIGFSSTTGMTLTLITLADPDDDASKVSGEVLDAALSDLLDEVDEGYVTKISANATIDTYINSEEGRASIIIATSATYQKKSDMTGYLLQIDVATEIGSYVDSQAGTAKIILNVAGTYQTKADMASYLLTSNFTATIEAYVDTINGKAKIVSAVSATYQTQAGMSSYTTNTALNSALANYVLNNTLDASIGAYVDSVAGKAKVVSAVSATYQTIASMSSYPTNTSLNTTLADYPTETELNSALANYVLNNTLDASIGAYIDTTTGRAQVVSIASGTFQTIANMSNYATTAALASYVLTSSLNASVGSYIEGATGSAKVVSACSGTYQTVSGMSSYATTAALASYVLTSSLNASMGSYIEGATGSAKVVAACNGTYQTVAGMSSYVTTTSLSASMGAYIDGATGKAKVVSACSGTYATTTSVATITSAVDDAEASIALVVGTSKLVSAAGAVNASLIITTINGGSTTINAARINLTGYITATNLSTSGQTTINGANITTGTISADRIDVDNIHIAELYIGAKKAIDGTSSIIYIGGSSSSVSFTDVYIYASSSIRLLNRSNSYGIVINISNNSIVPAVMSASSLGTTSAPWQNCFFGNLTIRTSGSSSYGIVLSDRELTPYASSTSYSHYLGTSANPWHYCYIGAMSARIACGGSATLSFYNVTPVARQVLDPVATGATLPTVLTKVNEIITKLTNLGLVS